MSLSIHSLESAPRSLRLVRRRRAVSGVDHVVVGLRDLAQAAPVWRRLGFTLTPLGRQVDSGIASHGVMFLRSHVELRGGTGEREGLASVVFGTANARAACSALRGAGIATGPLQSLSQLLAVGEGDVAPHRRFAALSPEAAPGLSAGLCEHLTPDLMRWPAWLNHANGAVSLKCLLAVVDDPAAIQGAYARLFGSAALTIAGGLLHVSAGDTRLLFATPAAAATLHPGAVPPRQASQGLVAMTIGVARTDATARFLDDFGVPFARGLDGSIRVAPAQATGVAIAFEAA